MQTKRKLVKRFAVAVMFAIGGFVIDNVAVHLAVTLPAVLLAAHYMEQYRKLTRRTS